MNFVKYVILGLLLISVSLALNVNIADPLVSVEKGQVANFPITITNTESASKTVVVSVESQAPVSVSDQAFTLDSLQSKNINVFAVTSALGEGAYLITLKVNNASYNLAVSVRESSPTLRFDAVYDSIEVVQGEYQDLVFLIRNEGPERLRNIVIEGDIPALLEPQFPNPIDLAPNELKQVKVRVNVPSDYRIDEYELTMKAGAGNLEEKTYVILKIIEGESLENKLSMEVLSDWEPIREEDSDNIIGYRITFRITNNGISDISGVNWKYTDLPDEWDVNDNESFSIKGFETIDMDIEFIPNNFNEQTINVTLMKGIDEIVTKKITFNGFRVGAATGLVVLGGDAFIGLIFVIVAALAIMYVRRKNKAKEIVEETQTRSYLEKLVEESKEEPKPRPRASKRRK